jgi:hypothetical protein
MAPQAKMPAVIDRHAIRGGLLALIVIAFLQLGLSALYWLPEPSAATVFAPTWEVVGLVLLLAGLCLIPSPPAWARRAVTVVLTLLAVLTIVISFGQGFLRREFARDLVLALDLTYVAALLKMLYDAESLVRFVLYMLLLAGGLALVVAGPYLGIRHLYRFASVRRRRSLALAVGALAYLAVGRATAGVHPPVSAEVLSQLSLVWNLKDPLAETARHLEAESAPTRALSLPEGPAAKAARPPRIYLFVVESYGQVLLAGAPVYERFPGFLRAQGAALEHAGYHARSKYLRAPVFGGGSWMADASLFCGVEIGNQKRYSSLFQSDVRCLPKVLEAAGYRTVWAAPSTTQPDDRFVRTYAFDQSYFQRDFGYAGPRFGWSFMPDQLVIDFVHRHEVLTHPDQPLFLAEVLTTSHVPWNLVPPLVDWDQIGDGAMYRDVQSKSFDNRLVSGSEYEAGYLASIEYSLETIASYLSRLPADDRSLVVVLGDHQPRQPVGQRTQDLWWVPIHVLSRDPNLVERFAPLGYQPGMLPVAPPGEPAGHEHLMGELLTATGATRK